MERMAMAAVRRWRCCKALILLRLEALISLWSIFSFSFFLVFWLIVGVGWWVLILMSLFFLVHWWVLMILPLIGWVMIWLDWVLGWVGDKWVWDWMSFRLSGLVFLDDVSWMVVIVAGWWWWWLGVEWSLVVMDCGSVRERDSEGGNNKKL